MQYKQANSLSCMVY